MMRIIAALLLMSSTAMAQVQNKTYQDSMGRNTGRHHHGLRPDGLAGLSSGQGVKPMRLAQGRTSAAMRQYYRRCNRGPERKCRRARRLASSLTPEHLKDYAQPATAPLPVSQPGVEIAGMPM
jgi:hypothetical protein